ncbi:MAG TPA: 4-alpha-glucanotransferase [Rhizomicrobium sp.]|jgi:4-alpha-glucanotransferase
MSNDPALLALASRAGLEVQWIDASGTKRSVGADRLRAVLKALDLPADNAKQISDSEEQLRRENTSVPSLIVARAREEVAIAACRIAEAFGESGERVSLRLREVPESRAFRAPREPGYYRIATDRGEFALAVAPARCLRPQDVVPERRLAGLAVQIYALRGGTSGAFGDFAALGHFARDAGRRGIDAILASPTHALFGADPGRFSPYSPSTRLFPNPLFADATLEGAPMQHDRGDAKPIDWASAGPAKFAALHGVFARYRARGDTKKFEHFCREGGERLLAHALFECLDAYWRGRSVSGFRNWPVEFRSPGATGTSQFARDHRQELEFQLFLQWMAARSAAAAQSEARAGMAIGIVADIAVGMNPEGSHAWSAPDELLRGLHVGAPPDVFNTRGQDWGLTTFSPWALQRSGFASFVATLRANMRHAGGVRLDHAMGLRRLWVIPAGAEPSDGVYLRYPERELLRLVALESQRARAIVVGEDLGTVPEGFRDTLAKAGVLGMQVLWFERQGHGRFTSPGHWRRDVVAMTTTHDLPTVAGWWSGYDIELRKRCGRLPGGEEQERAHRARDRVQIWSAFRRAKCAAGPAPLPESAGAAINAALGFIGRTRSTLAIASAEDIGGQSDQPNLPGTTDEHPNWRLRLPPGDLLHDKAARARLETFTAARRSP